MSRLFGDKLDTMLEKIKPAFRENYNNMEPDEDGLFLTIESKPQDVEDTYREVTVTFRYETDPERKWDLDNYGAAIMKSVTK